MKIIFKIILFTLLINIFPPAKAEILSFDGILDEAVKNSIDLKIAKTNVKISTAGIKEAKSEYYPIINLGYNAKYDKDLTDGNSSLDYVGDTLLLGTTRYQNSISASLQYNLYDFGIRGKKLSIAKKDKTQKQIEYNRNLRDLKVKLVEAYAQALLTYRELTTNKKIMALDKELLSMYEKLHTAGTIRTTEVSAQAINTAKLTNKIDDLTVKLQKNLEDLSFYTLEDYNANTVELLDFKNNSDDVELVNLTQKEEKEPVKLEIKEIHLLETEKLPEYKVYKLEIEKKKEELSILKRQRLPHFVFSSGYYLYGTDRNDFFDSMDDMTDRSLTFRISSTIPVFDGFKNKARREKTELEIEKLKLERQKKVKQMKTYYEKLYKEADEFTNIYDNEKISLDLVEKKMNMLERLKEQEVIGKITYINQKKELISQKSELEQAKINNDFIKYKLQVLNEAKTEEGG